MCQCDSTNVFTDLFNVFCTMKSDGNENVINIYNDEASYFAFVAKKEADRAEVLVDRANAIVKESTNVNINNLTELENKLMLEIDKKKDEGDYALREELPQNFSELENDMDFFPVSDTDKALMQALPLEDTLSDKLLMCNGEKLYWNDMESLLSSSTAYTTKQKATIVSFSFPSSKYNDLTLGATGSDYTAPANGYFTLNKKATASSQSMQVINMQSQMAINIYSTAANNDIRAFVPVKKGQKCRINYTLGGTTTLFRFIYAEGDA